MDKRGLPLGKIFIGSIVIFIGTAFLLEALGIMDINLSFNFVWPALLIFLGLSMLSRSGLFSSIIGAAAIIIVIALLAFAVFGDKRNSRHSFNKDINIAKEGKASSAEVKIKFNAGKLEINGSFLSFVSGKFKSDFMDLETSSSLEGEIQKISLEGKGSAPWRWRGGGNILDLNINSKVPMEINLDMGASNLEIYRQ